MGAVWDVVGAEGDLEADAVSRGDGGVVEGVVLGVRDGDGSVVEASSRVHGVVGGVQDGCGVREKGGTGCGVRGMCALPEGVEHAGVEVLDGVDPGVSLGVVCLDGDLKLGVLAVHAPGEESQGTVFGEVGVGDGEGWRQGREGCLGVVGEEDGEGVRGDVMRGEHGMCVCVEGTDCERTEKV